MSKENKFKKVLAASGSESILAVIEGLPVDASGYFMSEEQMQAVEDSFAAAEATATAATEALSAMTEQRDDNALQAQQAVAELATANGTIATRDAEIARLNARIDTLENGTDAPKQTSTKKDKTAGDEKVPFHNSKENPGNKLASSLFGYDREEK